jgi:hypothetical protein
MHSIVQAFKNIVNYRDRTLELVPVSQPAAQFFKPVALEKNNSGSNTNSMSLAYDGISLVDTDPNAQELDDDFFEDPNYMTTIAHKAMELQSENASRESGGLRHESKLQKVRKEPDYLSLEDWRALENGPTTSVEPKLPVPEPVYAKFDPSTKAKFPVIPKEGPGPAVPAKSLQLMAQLFLTEVAHCRTYCRAVKQHFFAKALYASGYALSKKMDAMEAVYLKSYNDTFQFFCEKNSEKVSSTALLRQAHNFANDAALGNVKALETEDAEKYADAWTHFTMNFSENGMPANYSSRPNKFSSRPLPPIPATVIESTRF